MPMASLSLHGSQPVETEPAPHVPRTSYMLHEVHLTLDDFEAVRSIADAMRAEGAQPTYGDVIRRALSGLEMAGWKP